MFCGLHLHGEKKRKKEREKKKKRGKKSVEKQFHTVDLSHKVKN